MEFTFSDVHFHQDSKGDREFGPVYGSIPLPDTLPITGGMTQAMPCRRELVEVRKKHERIAAAYEIAIWYLLAANQELGEKTKQIEALLRENLELKLALGNARTHARTIDSVTTREFAARCGVTATQLSEWTGEPITTPPQFVD